MYPIIKHSHLLFIGISFILFNLRFFLRFLRPQQALPKPLRILPHANDSLLLLSGIALTLMAGWSPFGNSNWLGVKLIMLVAYITLGFVCIKTPARTLPSNLAYVAALFCFALIAFLARFKPF